MDDMEKFQSLTRAKLAAAVSRQGDLTGWCLVVQADSLTGKVTIGLVPDNFELDPSVAPYEGWEALSVMPTKPGYERVLYVLDEQWEASYVHFTSTRTNAPGGSA